MNHNSALEVARSYLFKFISIFAVILFTHAAAAAPSILERTINAGDDDAYEVKGRVELSDTILDLKAGNTVGLRFDNIYIPQGAIIYSAYIQFTAASSATDSSRYVVKGEAVDVPSTYSSSRKDISSRSALTDSSIEWVPGDWIEMENGVAERTPDISPIIQEIVNRPGWQSANPVSIIVEAVEGARDVYSYEGAGVTPGGGGAFIPTLYIEYAQRAAMPAIDPAGGAFTNAITITLNSATPGSLIYYTLDGTTPSVNSNLYSGPFQLSSSATINAIAIVNGYADSEISSASFVFTDGTPKSTSTGIESVDDDGYEKSNGSLLLSDSVLELREGYIVGIRFNNVDIPQGSTVADARIHFTSEAASSDEATLTIQADIADNALPFAGDRREFSSKSKTSSSVLWSPGAWNVGERGADQVTSNFAPVIQEVIDRSGWVNGNSITILISGELGQRAARSYDGYLEHASIGKPVLNINFIGPPTVKTPVITPASGEYINQVDVSIETTTSGAQIYYTLNGEQPTTNSLLYGGSFQISSDTLVTALGVKNGFYDSETATRNFIVVPNQAPVADAGVDQVVKPGDVVTLNGLASSDPDGEIASYTWTQTSGPPVLITPPGSATPTITAPSVASDTTLTFQLQVTDGYGATSLDSTSVIVRSNSTNVLPVANAGPDVTLMEVHPLSLDGSASADSDGFVANYLWQQVGGPAIVLSGSDSAVVSFLTPSVTGDATLTFMLTVIDNEGSVSYDLVSVDVTDMGDVGSPVTSGTISTSITENSVFLSGSVYSIPETIYVASNATLTVQDGATLMFGNGAQLIVQGGLNVLGTNGAPAVFTAEQILQSSKAWDGILIDGGSAAIDNARIEGALYGVRFKNSGGSLTNSLLRNNHIGVGLWDHNAEVTITNNVFEGNLGSISISSQNLAQLPPAIENNSFLGVAGDNIFVVNEFGSGITSDFMFDISSNWWGTTRSSDIAERIIAQFNGLIDVNFTPYLDGPDGYPVPGDYLIGPIAGTIAPTVSGKPYEVIGTIKVPEGSELTILPGVELDFMGYNTGIYVNGSLTVGSTSGAKVTLSSGKSSPTNTDWQGVVSYESSAQSIIVENAEIAYANMGVFSNYADVLISDSVVHHINATAVDLNSISLGTAENVEIHSSATGIATGRDYSSPDAKTALVSHTITGSKIHVNDVGIRIRGAFAVNPNADINISGNSIYENNAENLRVELNRDYFDYYEGGDIIINVENNWWGTADPVAIAKSITDYSDDPYNLPIVDFLPILDSPNGQSIHESRYLHGPFNQDTVLSAGTAYDVVGGLIVPAGITLTIEEGVTLRFHEGAQRFYVAGRLLVNGTSTSPVFMGASTEIDPWSGVILTGGVHDSVINHAVISNAAKGIYTRGASAVIDGVISHGNRYGVYVGGDSSSVITNSYLIDNETGMFVNGNDANAYTQGGAPYTGNTNPSISNSGIFLNSLENYRASNFRSTDGSLCDGDSTILHAENNWWGTGFDATIEEIEAEIESKVFHRNDNTSCQIPSVDYIPFFAVPLSDLPPVPVLNGASTFYLTADPGNSVTGEAEPNATVLIYDNGVMVAKIQADATGSFEAIIVLEEGRNFIQVAQYDGQRQSMLTNPLLVMLDSVPPAFTKLLPSSDVAIGVTAVDMVGAVSESASVTVNGVPVSTDANNSFTYVLSSLNTGVNPVSVTATDEAGNVTQVNLEVAVDLMAPTAPDVNLLTVAPVTSGIIEITAGSGFGTVGDSVRFINSRTGEHVVTVINADGSITARIAALATDELIVISLDSAGNQSPPRFINVSQDEPILSLDIRSHQSGGIVSSRQIMVMGTYSGPANTGITVNGVRSVTVGEWYYSDNVRLVEGDNTIDVVATTVDGESVSSKINVLYQPQSVEFVTGTSVGIAPFTASFTLENTETDPDISVFGCEIDAGTRDASDNLYGSCNGEVTYDKPGIYVAIAKVELVEEVSRAALAPQYIAKVNVVLDPANVDGKLMNVYYQFLKRLKSGDLSSIANYVTPLRREKYQPTFEALSPYLISIADNFGEITGGIFNLELADYQLKRIENDVPMGYSLQLSVGADGVWRIDSM